MEIQPTTREERISGEQHLVAFRLDRQVYALPIDPVERIIPMVTITALPQVNNSVAGVINVRGQAIPVVDLRRHLGVHDAPIQQYTPILLVWVGQLLVGLIVDEVIDMLNLPAQHIARPAEMMPDGLEITPILQGLAYTDRGTVLVLDIAHLFTPGQARKLAQALEALPEMDADGTEEQAEEQVEEQTEEPADPAPPPDAPEDDVEVEVEA
ncbi:MAG: chemotaxis protein CheW [Anaerolineae bacterium]|nr:chemotaxis protein CheW [Anaerolineae bacterium]